VLPDFQEIITLTLHGGAESFSEGYFFDNIVIDFSATPSEPQTPGEAKSAYR
jgi:hypothetical protein